MPKCCCFSPKWIIALVLLAMAGLAGWYYSDPILDYFFGWHVK